MTGRSGTVRILDRDGLDALLGALRDDGLALMGPTVSQGAVVYGAMASTADLPLGWGDEQRPGQYRLRRRDDDALFGYAVGPDSWKRVFHPPELRLWSARRDGAAFHVDAEEADRRPVAIIGARSCELRAIAVLDRVLDRGPFTDPDYRARRAGAFIVAVSCAEPAGTCFCASMGTGPRPTAGFDLLLTELLDGGHRFAIETGSDRGAALLERVPTRAAAAGDARAVQDVARAATARMGRRLETAGLRELMAASLEHPHWRTVAERCLTCGNCTLVCPTCFCTSVRDASSLDGERAERQRSWDSCFTVDFSHLHAGGVRASPASRYRQWLTHKLGTWHDQFGTSGCVGCGRCIAWCPVGIDLTEEVAALRSSAATRTASPAAAEEEEA